MLTAAQAQVTAGSAVSLGLIPPGAQAALSIPAGTIYIGEDPAVTTSTGAPVTGYALLPRIAASSGYRLYAATASGTVTAGLIIAAAG